MSRTSIGPSAGPESHRGQCVRLSLQSLGGLFTGDRLLAQDLEHNPLERLNKEIKRRTRVVGIFPNAAAIILLVGAMLLEQQEEWQLDGHHVFSELSMAKLDNISDPPQDQETAALAAAA